MKKLARIVLATAAVAGAFVPSVRAEDQPSTPCDSQIYVFSYVGVDYDTAVTGGFTPEATCLVVSPEVDGTPDPRIIYPHATRVFIRYTPTTTADAEPITAYLDGLGYENEAIQLAPGELIDGSCCAYDSADLPIDPNLSGTFKVTIPFIDEETGEATSISDTYRTTDVAVTELAGL